VVEDSLVGRTGAQLAEALGGSPSTKVLGVGDYDRAVRHVQDQTDENEALVSHDDLDVAERGRGDGHVASHFLLHFVLVVVRGQFPSNMIY